MNRPFNDKAILEQMLQDRANGWSLASLMDKYNVKSHRSIVYLCQKHHVQTIKPVVLYHAMSPQLTLTIRHTVRQFPTKPAVVIPKKDSQQLVERISWWAVEKYVRDNQINKPKFSFTL